MEEISLEQLEEMQKDLFKKQCDLDIQKAFVKHFIKKKQSERLHNVSQQRELLIAFLEMNNWLSLEDEENAKGVVDCYLKANNCSVNNN